MTSFCVRKNCFVIVHFRGQSACFIDCNAIGAINFIMHYYFSRNNCTKIVVKFLRAEYVIGHFFIIILVEQLFYNLLKISVV